MWRIFHLWSFVIDYKIVQVNIRFLTFNRVFVLLKQSLFICFCLLSPSFLTRMHTKKTSSYYLFSNLVYCVFFFLQSVFCVLLKYQRLISLSSIFVYLSCITLNVGKLRRSIRSIKYLTFSSWNTCTLDSRFSCKSLTTKWL